METVPFVTVRIVYASWYGDNLDQLLEALRSSNCELQITAHATSTPVFEIEIDGILIHSLAAGQSWPDPDHIQYVVRAVADGASPTYFIPEELLSYSMPPAAGLPSLPLSGISSSQTGLSHLNGINGTSTVRRNLAAQYYSPAVPAAVFAHHLHTTLTTGSSSHTHQPTRDGDKDGASMNIEVDSGSISSSSRPPTPGPSVSSSSIAPVMFHPLQPMHELSSMKYSIAVGADTITDDNGVENNIGNGRIGEAEYKYHEEKRSTQETSSSTSSSSAQAAAPSASTSSSSSSSSSSTTPATTPQPIPVVSPSGAFNQVPFADINAAAAVASVRPSNTMGNPREKAVQAGGMGRAEAVVEYLEWHVEAGQREIEVDKHDDATNAPMKLDERGGFTPMQVLRSSVERPGRTSVMYLATLLGLVAIVVILAFTSREDFVKFLWSNFPLQIEDTSFNGGFHRTLGVNAALATSQQPLGSTASVELVRSVQERRIAVAYRVLDGDVFNMDSLSKAFAFEESIRQSDAFKAYCLLDWTPVDTGGFLYAEDGTLVIEDDTGKPVQGALLNAELSRFLSASVSLAATNETEYLLNQTIANVYSYSQSFLNKTISLECMWPKGPIRPASVYNETTGTCSTVPGSTEETLHPIAGTKVCQPMGLLTAEGKLDEQFKNARLKEYSMLSEATAPQWFTFVDKEFGSGSSTCKTFRSYFPFGWPLNGFNNTIQLAEQQSQLIASYVVTDFLSDLIKRSKVHEGDLTLTFEALESGALDLLFKAELFTSVPTIISSVCFIWVALAIAFRTSVGATFGLTYIFGAVAPAYLLYRICGFKYVGLYHLLSVVVVLFVGADAIIVFMNRWDQAERLYAPVSILAQSNMIDSTKQNKKSQAKSHVRERASELLRVMAEQALKPIETSKSMILSWSWKRLSWTWRRAARTLVIASATLTCSLCVNVSLNLPAFRSFAIFAAFLAFFVTVIIICAWPSALIFHRKYLEDRRCCLIVPKSTYDFDLQTIDPTDEVSRLTKVEAFFYQTWTNFINSRRISLTLIFLGLVGLFIYFAVALTVDNRDVASAIFVESHPINRYNELRDKFRSGNTIRLNFAFGLDKNQPVDRRYADIMDPSSYGSPVFSQPFSAPSSLLTGEGFNLWAAKDCLLNLCEYLESANDRLRLPDASPLTQPSCLLTEMSAWLDHGDVSSYGFTQFPGGLRNTSLTQPLFWQAFYIFLAFETTFCVQNGESGRCINKYRDNMSMKPPSAALNVTLPIVHMLTMSAYLSQSRALDYKRGIALFHEWEDDFNKFMRTDPGCSSTAMPEVTGFQLGHNTAWDPWHFFFFQRVLTDEVTRALGFAGALVFASFAVSTGDVYLAFLCVFFVGCVLALQLGVISLMGYRVGVVTVFPLLVLPGMSALHICHIADAYIHSRSFNPLDRVREALTKNGYPVVLSSVVNMGACIFFIVSEAAIFRNFGVMIFLMYVFTIVASLIVFPSVLIIAGPSGESSNLYAYIRRRCLSKTTIQPVVEPMGEPNIVRDDDPDTTIYATLRAKQLALQNAVEDERRERSRKEKKNRKKNGKNNTDKEDDESGGVRSLNPDEVELATMTMGKSVTDRQ